MMRVLVGCEYSGRVRDAFRRRGHDAISCDIIPSGESGYHHQGDVLEILDDGWDLMIAFPPCTHIAVSGARWFKEKRKHGLQQEAIQFVRNLWEAPIEKVCIENPVGVINQYLPDMPQPQYIQPYLFGSCEQKKTGLWLRNLPPLRPTDIVRGPLSKHSHLQLALPGIEDAPPHKQSTWMMGPSPDRGHQRSLTFTGIAEAMADQWGGTKHIEAEEADYEIVEDDDES